MYSLSFFALLCLIPDVWLDDDGLYICEAKNQFGTIKTEARVSITGLGRLNSVFFYYNLETMATTMVWLVALRLHIFKLRYTFILKLPAEPPMLAQGSSVVTTGIGQSLSIPCMLLDGKPLPERHWFKNEKPVRMVYFQICAILHTDNIDVLV